MGYVGVCLAYRIKKLRVTSFDMDGAQIHKYKKVTLMIHANNQIIKHKTGMLNLVQKLLAR